MDILRTCFRHKQNNYYYAVFLVNKIPLSKKVMFIVIVIVYGKKCPLILLLQLIAVKAITPQQLESKKP